MSLAKRVIALAEGRQLEELVQMLEKESATVLRCPMVSILDPADDGPALDWLAELAADHFNLVILLTGEGLRRLLACAARHGKREQMVAAFSRTRIMTRGPKPVRALKEVGLSPALSAQMPTTAGVIAALQAEPLRGQTVGVQLYSESNPPLTQFLQDAGATVRTVRPYVYAPAADADRVAALFEEMDHGRVDALVFTSSPQVDRLFEVADERGCHDLLMRGLGKTKIAAVGPIVAENLQHRHVRVDICPEQGFVMKNLVQLVKRALA
jgi:uroporphyrinogen-III synthase